MKVQGKDDLTRLLKNGAKELGILLSEDKITLFYLYMEELKEWNKGLNLTTIREDREIITRHFLDSLTAFKFLKPSWRLLDIGSGAGFPGIPLKIVMPGLKVTLLESREKKVFFLRHIIRTLDLKAIDALHGRAEDMAKKREVRGTFDAAILRAVSSIEDSTYKGLPFIKEGGILLHIKGEKSLAETERLNLPSIKPAGAYTTKLPFSDRLTVVLAYRKIA